MHAAHGAFPVAVLNVLPASQSAATGAALHTVSALARQAVLTPLAVHALHAAHGAFPVAVLNVLPASQSAAGAAAPHPSSLLQSAVVQAQTSVLPVVVFMVSAYAVPTHTHVAVGVPLASFL